MKLESIWTAIKPQFADFKPNFMGFFFFFFTLNDARNNTDTKLSARGSVCKLQTKFHGFYLFFYTLNDARNNANFTT